MALAAICHRRRFLPANRCPSIRPCPSNADHSCPPTSATVALDRVARTRILDPPCSNPHSARGALAALPYPPNPRFPPLEVFVRRPPECAARFVSGRHPKTFTKTDVATLPGDFRSSPRSRHQSAWLATPTSWAGGSAVTCRSTNVGARATPTKFGSLPASWRPRMRSLPSARWRRPAS
jgi:hypothetical protein